jgi:hypothetical protein
LPALRLRHRYALVDKTRYCMGVNARGKAPDVLARVRVRQFDSADRWKYVDES